MGKSPIEWTHATWNPVSGCHKISRGCKHCYAQKLHNMRHTAYMEGKRMPEQYAQPFNVIQLHRERVKLPLHWKKPQRIFVNSMSDLFHERIPFDFLDDVFETMRCANWHIFQVLTKRPEQMLEYFWTRPQIANKLRIDFKHVWFGVSTENQEAADKRIPLLLQVNAEVRFISAEPLVGALNISNYLPETGKQYLSGLNRGLQWIIAGGETGNDAFPLHPDWERNIRTAAAVNSVPYMFKQWGEYLELNTALDIFGNNAVKDMKTVAVSHDGKAITIPGTNESFDHAVALMTLVGRKRSGCVVGNAVYHQFPPSDHDGEWLDNYTDCMWMPTGERRLYMHNTQNCLVHP